MSLNHQAHGRDRRWRPISLATVAGSAGWHDVVRCVTATLDDWNDVILRKALRWLATIGAAVSIGRLDRLPVFAGQGRWKVAAKRISLLYIGSVVLIAFIPIGRSPSPSICGSTPKIGSVPGPGSGASLLAMNHGIGSYAQHPRLSMFMVIALRIRSVMASSATAVCLMLFQLATVYANNRRLRLGASLSHARSVA